MFLAMGVGADDLFVLVDAWKQTNFMHLHIRKVHYSLILEKLCLCNFTSLPPLFWDSCQGLKPVSREHARLIEGKTNNTPNPRHSKL